ncbi:MAG: hypothetical protein U9P71_06995 [Campylobacterota bacterium]|nr:hypothetical protein [Campylobacterota bacterium]
MLNISWKSDNEISFLIDYYEQKERIDVNIADPYDPYQAYETDEYGKIDYVYQNFVKRLISTSGLFSYELQNWSLSNNIAIYNLGKLDQWGNTEKIMELETRGNTNDMLLSADEKYLFISDGLAGIQIVEIQ